MHLRGAVVVGYDLNGIDVVVVVQLGASFMATSVQYNDLTSSMIEKFEQIIDLGGMIDSSLAGSIKLNKPQFNFPHNFHAGGLIEVARFKVSILRAHKLCLSTLHTLANHIPPSVMPMFKLFNEFRGIIGGDACVSTPGIDLSRGFQLQFNADAGVFKRSEIDIYPIYDFISQTFPAGPAKLIVDAGNLAISTLGKDQFKMMLNSGASQYYPDEITKAWNLGLILRQHTNARRRQRQLYEVNQFISPSGTFNLGGWSASDKPGSSDMVGETYSANPTTTTSSAPCYENVAVISFGGSYKSEVTWGIRYNGNVILSGSGGQTKYICLSKARYEVYGKDSYGDSWNGANLTIQGVGGNQKVYLAGWTGPEDNDNKDEVKTYVLIDKNAGVPAPPSHVHATPAGVTTAPAHAHTTPAHVEPPAPAPTPTTSAPATYSGQWTTAPAHAHTTPAHVEPPSPTTLAPTVGVTHSENPTAPSSGGSSDGTGGSDNIIHGPSGPAGYFHQHGGPSASGASGGYMHAHYYDNNNIIHDSYIHQRQNELVDVVKRLQKEIENLQMQLAEPQKYMCEVATKFCAPGTKWIDGNCVATFDGIISACENERPGWEWTCRTDKRCTT